MAKVNLSVGLIAGIIIYFAMMVYGDYEDVLSSISSFKMGYIPILLALVLTNYLLRAIKWHYFFRVLHIDISFKENLWVSLSGLAMSITPGKAGEVWKSWLIRDLRGYEVHRTVPIVFMDRITDVVAMLTLASFGILILRVNVLSFVAIAGILLSMLIVLSSERIMLKIIGRFERIRTAYMSSLDLLKFKPFLLAVLISLIAWFMECLAFYLTFRGLSANSGIFESTFIYATSSIVGAMTMLPGGLGATETSIAGLSGHLLALNRSTIVAATFIIRAATLWFAVAVGAFTYLIGRKLLCQRSM
jgi:glycosyltransferase 2 family protein